MSAKNTRKKGSRFNALGRASTAYIPRYKLYKAPMSRVKQYNTVSACYTSLMPFVTPQSLDYFGWRYSQASPVNPPALPNYGVLPSGNNGLLAMCEGAGFRIPRYLQGSFAAAPGVSSDSGVGVPSGQQQMSPLSCRFSDTIRVIGVNVTRSIHNKTTVPFTVRTFIFHNTGKKSPAWGNTLAFGDNVPWYTPATWPALSSIVHGYVGAPYNNNAFTVNSGLRINPTNLFQSRTRTDITGIAANSESISDFIAVNADILDRKSDLYLDNLVTVGCRESITAPTTADGSLARVVGVSKGVIADMVSRQVSPSVITSKTDNFSLPVNKSLTFEDEGYNATCVAGDLQVVHLLCPTEEPCPWSSGWVGAEGAETRSDSYVCPNMYGQIQITTTVQVLFTDGT